MLCTVLQSKVKYKNFLYSLRGAATFLLCWITFHFQEFQGAVIREKIEIVVFTSPDYLCQL